MRALAAAVPAGQLRPRGLPGRYQERPPSCPGGETEVALQPAGLLGNFSRCREGPG